ncbi:hypothetical protein UFOVP343_36 [uncultured Caudovirales phage]|uniref:Uncharacterized protein n=1 Tax=uncultured Caudovirales phage TaxID=2100421 RepID=A0A6J5M5F0_9CAUD|nr:hypothetical protein UFOVP343_36 [uncultured Caudovirales phage]
MNQTFDVVMILVTVAVMSRIDLVVYFLYRVFR